MAQFTLTVDGKTTTVEAEADEPLLYALRGQLQLKGPKFGCGLAQCGACTVIINGSATRSCVLPVAQAAQFPIRTLDGLGTSEHPHPVQAAFMAEEAAQCGYCTNGWIMTAVAMLERDPHISDADIRTQLAGLKCRCGTHLSILRAIRHAADSINADSSSKGKSRNRRRA